ncbi:hypothetical protein LTR08_006124 [Meristemomyces frigidus]|nr:hypothetical protein LTR08_006124 [Meristemomyces frigidus]
MTATNGDDGDDYQHWPDEDGFFEQTAVAAPGYDSHNGLRYHNYVPGGAKSPSPDAPKTQPVPQPQIIYSYPQPQMMTYPPMQYAYGQPAPMGYPAPAYYGYAPQMMPQPVANYQIYQPVIGLPQKSASPKPMKWQGRTKAEVEEDNMKIASREGAYDKRKVVPVGMKDDQMMWVVELDGSHTLRTYVTIKDLKGEWKKDPRYEDAYYFVREEEAEKKD